MSVTAIVGAGELGGAIAHALTRAPAVRAITIVDGNESVAAGKALDIQQSNAIDRSAVRLTATADVLAASSAAVIVIADDSATGEWRGDAGLAIVERLARAGTGAAFVFAGPGQI